MLPLHLLLGLVVGLRMHEQSFRRLLTVVIACSVVVWGVVIGLSDPAITTFLGGAALALANVAVGALVTFLGRQLFVRTTTATRSH